MFLDGYDIGELIAESARNAVRRARRQEDGKRVILKTPAQEFPTRHELRRLEYEYRILELIRSPGVIRPLALERAPGKLAIVLEDFGGERLPVRANKGLPLERFFPLASAIVSALADVHAQGIVHKDINPRNVLMNPHTGELKIIDFSLSSELRRQQTDPNVRAQLEGTLPYMSPEQTGRTSQDVDYRTDYYSLGVTFFELLSGTLPYTAPDVLGYIHCHLSSAVVSVQERNADVPLGLANIVCRLMAKDPDQRYQSAAGLLHDLSRCEREFHATGKIAEFVLGERDISERFEVSQQLEGRDAEISELLQTFDAAAAGAAKLLLVSGYAGVGKSSLVRQLHRPIVGRRARFTSGKFDQLERNVPYGALVQALREHLKRLLTESEERLLAHRRNLESCLRGNGGLLSPMLPELVQIMGPLPAVAELSPKEAQARLHRAFRDLIQTFATPQSPFVLFLDDLQWTDGSTPSLLVYLLTDGGLRHVLLLGAYRDNEVGSSHLFHHALADIQRKQPEVVHQLQLGPLSQSAVERIVARTLHCEIEQGRPVADVVFQKTEGNPFFCGELLYQLHSDKAIYLDRAQGGWAWDAKRIGKAAFSDNVVDFMLARVQQLPAASIDVLKFAACFGNEFELLPLAHVLDSNCGAVARALWPAVEQRLVLPRGNAYQLLLRDGDDDGAGLEGESITYAFPHDRVVQAVYSLLGETERAESHARIGALLRDALPEGERLEKVFDFVDHLNLGRRATDPLEARSELALFNMQAGTRARRSGAYETALGYLEHASRSLTPQEWSSRSSQRFEIEHMRVECLSLAGKVDLAYEQSKPLFEIAPDECSLAAASRLKAVIEEQQSRLSDSVDTIRDALSKLGIELPSDGAAVEAGIGAGIGTLQQHLARVEIEDLARLPKLEDPLQIAQTELLFQLIPPASQVNPPLFILAELTLFDHALTHGRVPGSAKNFMDCGIVLGAILNNYSGAYRMGKVAFELLAESAPTPLEAAVNFVFGCFISHWGAHFQEGLDALTHAHRRGVDLGDVLHASYATIHYAKTSFFAGKDLAECMLSAERALAYAQKTGNSGHEALPRMLVRALEQLGTPTRGDSVAEISDEQFIEEVKKTENGHFLLVLGQTQTWVHLILGDLEAAARWDEFASRYIEVGNGAFPVPDYHLARALLLVRKAKGQEAEERAETLRNIEAEVQKLEAYAEACPANFEHKLQFACAELARVNGGNIEDVLESHKALQATAGNDFCHIRALSLESQADFWHEKGQPELARECLLRAYHLYRYWGATAKTTRMEAQDDWLRRAQLPDRAGLFGDTLTTATLTTASESNTLDIASVIKASEAISGEVKPEGLFSALLQTIIENAGAERGFLLVDDDSTQGLTLAAHASVHGEELDLAHGTSVDACTCLAREVVRYVVRSGETVVLEDAQRDSLYNQDEYIVSQGVRSVLCMPILTQGRLLAVLYVENNAASQVFTPARVNLLKVLGGQAAISIANAQLYERLEDKVEERTRQLAERNREVGVMLNSIKQGIFTIDENLRIGARYSAHLEQLLGTKQVAGQDCIELLFRGSQLSTEVIDNMRSALEFCFGSATLFAEANSSYWVREFERRVDGDAESRFFEVDWSPIADADDNVGKMLVAVRDVTQERQLSARAAQHARELDIVGQVLDCGVSEFNQFTTQARPLLEALQGDGGELDTGAIERGFGVLHTAKGNARMLGLNHLAAAIHEAENAFDTRGAEGAVTNGEYRRQGVLGVLNTLSEYEGVVKRKLGEVTGRGPQANQRLVDKLLRCIDEVHAGEIAAAGALEAIQDVLQRSGAVALDVLVHQASRGLPGVARQLGKPTPMVVYTAEPYLLSARWAKRMRDCLLHAFNNCLDHGIEDPTQRAADGKAERGNIVVTARQDETGFVVHVTDDGSGLNLAALRVQSNTPGATDEQLAERVFHSGVSTASALTSVSGRGVGLNAVRDAMSEAGGRVEVAFTGPGKAGVRPFELIFKLPASAVLPVKKSASIRPSQAPSPLGSSVA